MTDLTRAPSCLRHGARTARAVSGSDSFHSTHTKSQGVTHSTAHTLIGPGPNTLISARPTARRGCEQNNHRWRAP